MLRTLPLALCACVFFASCISLPSTSPARTKVDARWYAHLDAARRKDASTIGDIYADDIVYIVDGEEVRGRAAIDAHETASLTAGDVLEVEHVTRDLLVDGERAYEIGTIFGQVRPAGESTRLVTFHFMARWHEGEDGVWRIQHLVGDFERPAAGQ